MLAAIDAFSLVLGATIATLAARVPAHTELLETCAGVLLIGGLFVCGAALPIVL